MENKVAIIIVVFNISNLIETQISLVKRFCKDDNFDIIVIDNSSNLIIASEIKNVVERLYCKYYKTAAPTADFSQSHASACNYAHLNFKDQYSYMFFLDHDNFPIKNFSITDILQDKLLGGVAQARADKHYFWPGCVMINIKLTSGDIVDFSTNSEIGLDTGGNLYKIIEKYGLGSCICFDQYEKPNSVNSSHHYYNLICNTKTSIAEFSFMHFINGSNWNYNIKNNDRINSLLQILKEQTK